MKPAYHSDRLPTDRPVCGQSLRSRRRSARASGRSAASSSADGDGGAGGDAGADDLAPGVLDVLGDGHAAVERLDVPDVGRGIGVALEEDPEVAAPEGERPGRLVSVQL